MSYQNTEKKVNAQNMAGTHLYKMERRKKNFVMARSLHLTTHAFKSLKVRYVFSKSLL